MTNLCASVPGRYLSLNFQQRSNTSILDTCLSMSEHFISSVGFCTTDLMGQELEQILPHLTEDLRRHIASGMSWTDRAKCLLLTSSVMRQEGTASMLERLKASHTIRLRCTQIEKTVLARTAAMALNFPELAATTFSSRASSQLYLEKMEAYVRNMQCCQQALQQAVDAFQIEQWKTA